MKHFPTFAQCYHFLLGMGLGLTASNILIALALHSEERVVAAIFCAVLTVSLVFYRHLRNDQL